MESGTRRAPVNGPGGAARGARLPESLAPPRNDFRNGRIANLARKATLPFSPPASPFLSVDSIRHITMKTRLPFLSPASVGNLFVVPSVSARRSFGTRWRAFRLMAVIVALPIAGVERAPAAAPATQGAGVLEGRVFNATSGVALGNARITITPGGLTAYSDASGEFRVTNVPPAAQEFTAALTRATNAPASKSVPAEPAVSPAPPVTTEPEPARTYPLEDPSPGAPPPDG